LKAPAGKATGIRALPELPAKVKGTWQFQIKDTGNAASWNVKPKNPIPFDGGPGEYPIDGVMTPSKVLPLTDLMITVVFARNSATTTWTKSLPVEAV
jgi:hypothetical protein